MPGDSHAQLLNSERGELEKVFRDGRFLTRQWLVEVLQSGLQEFEAGLTPSLYCGHSFRIGAARTAAKKGMEDSVIKTMGRYMEEPRLYPYP